MSAVISMIIGILVGRMTFEGFNKNPQNSVTNLADSDLQSDSSEESTSSNYPFTAYMSFLVNSSKKIVDTLNSNPIDKIYKKNMLTANHLKRSKKF